MPKHVVVFEAFGSGAPLVPRAKAMGHRVSVVSRNAGGRRLPQSIQEQADRVIEVDTNDEAAVTAAVDDLAAGEGVDAIISGNEYYVPLVARIAARHGCHGLDPARVARVRDKHAMRQALAARGVRHPRFWTVASHADIDRLRPELPFPLVLKPRGAAGSFHVTKVGSIEALHAAYAGAQADPHRELDRELGESMLLEDYLEGPEYSIEGVIAVDGPRILSITEKFLGPPPGFLEIGHIVEAPVPPALRARIAAYFEDVVAALDLRLGVFHGEVRFDPEGAPVLVEVGARLPGDRIAELVSWAGGPSMADLMIRAHLGEAIRLDDGPYPRTAGIAFFAPPAVEGWHDVAGMDEVRTLPGCQPDTLSLDLDKPLHNLSDYRCRVGNVIFAAPTYEEVRASMAGAWDRVRFVA